MQDLSATVSRRRSVQSFEHDQKPFCDWYHSCDYPELWWSVVRCSYDFPTASDQIRSYLSRNQIVSSVWLGYDVINDFAATNFGLAITHDFDDQSCDLSTIYPRLLKNRSYIGCKQIAILVWLRLKGQCFRCWDTSCVVSYLSLQSWQRFKPQSHRIARFWNRATSDKRSKYDQSTRFSLAIAYCDCPAIGCRWSNKIGKDRSYD